MSKHISRIPLTDISRIQLYINQSRKTLAQIKTETGADYLLNGGVYSGTKAVMHLRADGYTWSEDPYHYPGYAWDTGADIGMELVPCGKANYINCTELIWQGVPNPKPQYNPDMGGARQRSAMGLVGDKLVLYCSTEPTTPERLRDELAAMGCNSALMLDGGGSSQCDFDGKRITSARKVHNLILVYLRHKEDKPVDGITQSIMTKSDCYKAGKTIKPKGIMVHSTATPGADALTIRDAWDRAGAEAAVHYIIDDKRTLQTLTDDRRAWHCGGAANNTHISFEICEPQECRLIPVEWTPLKRGSSGWAVKRLQMELQARGYDPKGVDGSFGPGCETALKACQRSLGLAADGSCGPATLAALSKRTGSYLVYTPTETEDYFRAVWGRAVDLCAMLCKEHGLDPLKDILCHSEGYKAGIASNHADVMHWFPRHGKSMDIFRAAVKAAMTVYPATDPLGEAVDKLAGAGLIDSPAYWLGGDYSTENVQALIIKWAATI